MDPRPDETGPSESDHVVHLFRYAALARSATRAGVVAAAAWLATSLFAMASLGAVVGPGNSINPLDPEATSLLVAAFGCAVLALLPFAAVFLHRWRGALRGLRGDLPAGSPWRRLVLAPGRSALQGAVAGVSIAIVLGLGFFLVAAWVAAESTGVPAGGSQADLLDLVATLPLLGMSVGEVVAGLLILRGLALPIAGSGVPRIDADLRGSRRAGPLTLPWAVVPPVGLFAITSGLAPSWELWAVSCLGLLAPAGLVFAMMHLARAYDRWLGLARRLVGLQAPA